MHSLVCFGIIILLSIARETISYPIKVDRIVSPASPVAPPPCCSDPNCCDIICSCSDITQRCGCSANMSEPILSKRFGCTMDGQCAPQCECDVTSQQCYCPPLRMPTETDTDACDCDSDGDCAYGYECVNCECSLMEQDGIVIVEYESTNFNKLEYYGRIVPYWSTREDIVGKLANVIKEHKVGKFVSIQLLHKHFELNDDEVIVETFYEDKIVADTYNMMDVNISNIYPYLFSLNPNGQIVPLEFVFGSEYLSHDEMKNRVDFVLNNKKFLSDFMNVLRNVADPKIYNIFGFGINHREYLKTKNTIEHSDPNTRTYILTGIVETTPVNGCVDICVDCLNVTIEIVQTKPDNDCVDICAGCEETIIVQEQVAVTKVQTENDCVDICAGCAIVFEPVIVKDTDCVDICAGCDEPSPALQDESDCVDICAGCEEPKTGCDQFGPCDDPSSCAYPCIRNAMGNSEYRVGWKFN